MKKIILYEAPVDDFMDSSSKESILKAQLRKYQNAKEGGGSNQNMMDLMYSLPNLESEHRADLLKLAKAIFISKFPKIKERVDNGTLKLDINFSDGATVRTTSQKVPTELIKQAKEVDPLFDERVKARNFVNATTQGSAWTDGFNSYKEIESQLNELNPNLIDKYKKFEHSATVYYNDNTAQLEQMAERSVGRVAFMDMMPDGENPGSWIIIVRAPFFPLLMHELQKAGRYFNSILYMPKDKAVNNALTKTTDTHKHEIKNMITGREISSKLKYLWSTMIDDYESWMDNSIQTQFNKMANDNPKLFNEIMYDGVLGNKPAAMDKFEKFTQMIVDALKKNPPKVERPDYSKLISKQEKSKINEPKDEEEEEEDLSWLDDVDYDED
jgi:hypothetical protein